MPEKLCTMCGEGIAIDHDELCPSCRELWETTICPNCKEDSFIKEEGYCTHCNYKED